MQIDPTVTSSGGGLYGLDIETVELTLVLDDENQPLVASVSPTTVSISYMSLDSGGVGEETPEPEPDNPYLYFGVDSQYFGFGSYPLDGLI